MIPEYCNSVSNVENDTDLDEFFDIDLIKEVELLYKNDKNLVSIDLPHKIFVYNQFNYYNKSDFYIAPRITKHKKGFIYGHCNFHQYGKTIKHNKRFLFNKPNCTCI